jgi:drug/metabolite transporter (DMT)-like permease
MSVQESMLLQILSVVGALMVLTAYALIQGGIWRELDPGYLALNIIGSLLLGVVAIADQRVGFILLEFAWAALGCVGVARAIRARKSTAALS